MPMSLITASGQLRHAYALLHASTVKDQRKFAEELLAPVIRALENAAQQESNRFYRDDMGR